MYSDKHKEKSLLPAGRSDDNRHKTKKTFGHCDDHNLQTAAKHLPRGQKPGEPSCSRISVVFPHQQPKPVLSFGWLHDTQPRNACPAFRGLRP